ncbi:MAG: hypothetical protein NPINA01_02620 [Nitrospinaceae bacterium]|nr:MAG: hypothetical protein NPINA01_02620 [Nitrospinaceae bacterium]
MKASNRSWIIPTVLMGLYLAGCTPSLKITKPVANSTVSSPVEVCFETRHIRVEPAKMGVNPGAGHHHILIDIPQPEDLSQTIPKGEGHIHMGDGSHCKMINLSPGLHTLQAIFADGNHVPVKPPLTTAITIVVKE